MNVAGVIIAAGSDSRSGPRARPSTPALVPVARAALGAGLSEVIVVVSDRRQADALPDEATILLDEGATEASALRCAVDWCVREGYEAIVCTVSHARPKGSESASSSAIWRALAASGRGPLVVASASGRHQGIYLIAADIWPVLPLEGAVERALEAKIELLTEFEVADALSEDSAGSSPAIGVDDEARSFGEHATFEEIARVRELLGREPTGAFTVVVRDAVGDPVVIRNAPLLHDGTPMPTRYWLVGKREQEAVGRLESAGGVRRIEAVLDPDLVARTHDRYAKERDALLDPGYLGPRPTGGVGGTRRGLKCLHAHLAWYLAGGRDPVGRHVAHELAGELVGPVGAIDCGTNSTRLLVLDRDAKVCARAMTITRLGEGVDTTGTLRPEAIERTLSVLGKYREMLDQFGVVRLRATTTSAARDATNREELLRAAREILGVDLEILDGKEEGQLSYAGATSSLESDRGPYLVVDVGGGSTEFVAGSPERPGVLEDVESLNIGCVRITERFLSSDPATSEEVDRARTLIADAVGTLRQRRPGLSMPRTLIGVAGTIATLATRRLGLANYDGEKTDGTRIPRDFVDKEVALLSSLTVMQRRALPGIEAARADVILGGVLVIEQVMEAFDFDELVYSERDILDGLAQSLL